MSPTKKKSARIAKAKLKSKVLKAERRNLAVLQNHRKCKQPERRTEPPAAVDVIVIPEFPEIQIKVVKRGKFPYTCKKCSKGFFTKESLDDHTPVHVLKKVVKEPNKRFRCDICAKEFNKLCNMNRHMRVHTGEKPWLCDICKKRFQQSHNLSKHLLTHLHVKPYHCEICNKQFGRNDVLDRHILTHSDNKPIKCSLCSKGFIRETQLGNHMKKKHPDFLRIDVKTEIIAETD